MTILNEVILAQSGVQILDLEGDNYIQSSIDSIYGSQQLQNASMGDFGTKHESQRENQYGLQLGKNAEQKPDLHEEKEKTQE